MNKFDIYLAQLDRLSKSKRARHRPVLIVQNNISNNSSPLTIVCFLGEKVKQIHILNMYISKNLSGMECDTILMANQIRTVDKRRLIKKIGEISDVRVQKKINEALKISLSLE